jgi:hypothetical protein
MRLWTVVKTCDVTTGIDACPVGHPRGGRCKRGQRVRTTEGIKSWIGNAAGRQRGVRQEAELASAKKAR